MELKKSIEGTFTLAGGDEVEGVGAAGCDGSDDGAKFNVNQNTRRLETELNEPDRGCALFGIVPSARALLVLYSMRFCSKLGSCRYSSSAFAKDNGAFTGLSASGRKVYILAYMLQVGYRDVDQVR